VILTIEFDARARRLHRELRAHHVTLLEDSRRFPGSNRQPQFNAESVARGFERL
jgi:hypothetical protein